MVGLGSHPEKLSGIGGERISRSEFLKRIGLLAGVTIAGCSPVRMILKSYPERYDSETNLRDAVLKAFVVAVVPGAKCDFPHATDIFFDSYYPFCKWSGFFISDLCDRSASLFGIDRFDRLQADQRTAVVQSGLDAGSPVSRLYSAAILMAQASVYAGIYDPDKGCNLIDFPGANTGYSREEMCYSHNERFVSEGLTENGNYA